MISQITRMNPLFTAVTVILFISVCFANDVTESETLSYCQTYFTNSIDSCLSIMQDFNRCLLIYSQSSDAFLENIEVVKENNDRNDLSVTVSYYTLYARDYFEEHMTLQSSPFESQTNPGTTYYPGPAGGSGTEVEECKFILHNPSVDRSYPGLDESIDSNVMQFHSYILAGAVDLLYTAYRDYRPKFDVLAIVFAYLQLRFSVTMLEQILGTDATIEQVMEYLEDYGVCTTKDYEGEVKAGRSLDPTCHRVFLFFVF